MNENSFTLKNPEREKQKKIVKEFMRRWGEKFDLCSKYIEDFKIPHLLIAPDLPRTKFKKLWQELVEEVRKEEENKKDKK